MKKLISNIYKHQANIYKSFMFISTVSIIVYLFPKVEHFKYEFQKGKPWLHKDLFAPFDYAIQKSEKDIRQEEKKIKQNVKLYFDVDYTIRDKVLKDIDSIFSNRKPIRDKKVIKFFKYQVKEIYKTGILFKNHNYITHNPEQIVFIINNNIVEKEIKHNELYTVQEAIKFIASKMKAVNYGQYKTTVSDVLYDILRHNVFYNKSVTKNMLDESLKNIIHTYGFIAKGTKVISKGEIVTGEVFLKLKSLKDEYENRAIGTLDTFWITLGYVILISCIILLLYLFLHLFRPEIFENNNKVKFLLFNILLMFIITIFVSKYNIDYIYAIPFCMLPIVFKIFFDVELGFFVYMLLILIVGFIVPNSFEFIFIQSLVGTMACLTKLGLLKRINFFISVGLIVITFYISYIGIVFTQEGGISDIKTFNFILFLLAGMFTLFVHPIIYIYEKVFGFISDISFIELSDTNSKLLKRLANKAPGTFQHSLQVANIAENAALEIGANPVLTRTGALYHDIGKMENPIYFTENQHTFANPHNELAPIESVKIIVDHITNGIEIAKKYKLPDSIIDFIRSHHGNSVIKYFYTKAKQEDENIEEEYFRYTNGLKPFSKETAIVMMSDSIEAASKSLEKPTYNDITILVDSIIDNQINDNQFINSNITFKEIEHLKKVFKNKLVNIYHLRIEYPK